jgi:prevent-host-death family protein
MKHVTPRGASRQFYRLLSSVEAGGHVVIIKRGRPIAVISPYRAKLSKERKTAVERLVAAMDEPVELRAPFRTFTRDEMHERP